VIDWWIHYTDGSGVTGINDIKSNYRSVSSKVPFARPGSCSRHTNLQRKAREKNRFWERDS